MANFAVANRNRPGKMAEWSNAAVLKTVDLNGSGGSNPSLSASESDSDEVASSGLQPFLFSLLLSGFVTDGPAGLSGLGYLD